ncbi:MAG: pectate lyase [Fibrobacterota bacterium]|nr:pectate lyase [Fibrobacterota bacterium]QQS06248.1 MAG: pectate lyase [Fibrobacterota bacterium]
MNAWSRMIAGFLLTALAGAATAYTPPASVVSALDKLRSYSDLTSAAGSMDIDVYANNMITWQMPHGGYYKAMAAKYVKPWDGKEALSSSTSSSGAYMGTFDNNATIQEMRLLAVRYKATASAANKTAFKNSFQKAVKFIIASELPNGGWPQMYPKRGNYSDMATYNDNAMVRAMVLIKDIIDKKAPFDSDIASTDNLASLKASLDKAVQFALKAQIINGGKPTVWCAQHDPSSYKPVAARAYELASKSGSESVGIAYFLMNWPDQTPAIQSAVKGAIAWFKKTKVTNLSYSSGTFTPTTNGALWYRFYEVDSDAYFFCDREGVSTKTQDITKISEERRTGYQWAGNYGSTLLGMEEAYLSALGLSAAERSPAQTGFSVRRTADGLSIKVLIDGMYTLRYLDLRGRVLLRQEVASNGGAITQRMPREVGHGVTMLSVSHIGGSVVGFFPIEVHE